MKEVVLFVTEDLSSAIGKNDLLKAILKKGVLIIGPPILDVMLRQENVGEIVFDEITEVAQNFVKIKKPRIRTGVFQENHIAWLE